MKYFELFFQNESPDWSVCVKGICEPTPEEATLFFSELVKKFGKVINVYPLTYDEAHDCFDCDNEDKWPVFGIHKLWY